MEAMFFWVTFLTLFARGATHVSGKVDNLEPIGVGGNPYSDGQPLRTEKVSKAGNPYLE